MVTLEVTQRALQPRCCPSREAAKAGTALAAPHSLTWVCVKLQCEDPAGHARNPQHSLDGQAQSRVYLQQFPNVVLTAAARAGREGGIQGWGVV